MGYLMNYNLMEILHSARRELKEGGVPGEMDADFIMNKVIGCRPELHPSGVLSDSEYAEFKSLIARRINREPMDSILGFTEFLGLNIPFSHHTLSPRQETEIMVDNIIRENKNFHNLQVLDLCSGSGCIGLSIAKYLDADVTLSDISSEALAQSQKNAKLNNIDVKFVSSDMFDNITGKFDIIVSNPPYIERRDLDSLEPEVRDYDPILALDGGEDGLIFYRRFALESTKYLKNGGLIYIEFGVRQAEQIKTMLEKNFENIEIIKDYSGIDRYIKARKKYVE
jgi:release factor glutamine methyltransferase